ncbi:MAG: DUF5818 domain-containing protein [Terracidiphilus sp.]
MKASKISLVLGVSTGLFAATGICAGASHLPVALDILMPLMQAAQTPPAAQPPQKPARSMTFKGTVVMEGKRYVLRDSSGKVFQLDNSARARQFQGKRVKVTGRVDANAKMIHIDRIERAGV